MQIYHKRNTPDGLISGVLDVVSLDSFAEQMKEFLEESGKGGVTIFKIELEPLLDSKEYPEIPKLRGRHLDDTEVFELEKAVRAVLLKGKRKRRRFTIKELEIVVADSVGSILFALGMSYPEDYHV